MTRISIDLLYKMAEEFEEAIPPPPATLPAGHAPVTDKPIAKIEVEEVPPTARFLFERDMSVGTIKELMGMLSEIFELSRGAATVLRTMSKSSILNPTSGIYAYMGPMNDKLDKINSLIGHTK